MSLSGNKLQKTVTQYYHKYNYIRVIFEEKKWGSFSEESDNWYKKRYEATSETFPRTFFKKVCVFLPQNVSQVKSGTQHCVSFLDEIR